MGMNGMPPGMGMQPGMGMPPGMPPNMGDMMNNPMV